MKLQLYVRTHVASMDIHTSYHVKQNKKSRQDGGNSY